MEPLELNLATQPFRNNTLLWLGYGLGALAVLAFGVWSVETHAEHRAHLARLHGELTSIDTDLARLARREAAARTALGRRDLDTGALSLQADKANEVISWKAFSWTRLFNRLEAVQPWNVSLTAVRPMFQAGGQGGKRGAPETDRRESVLISVDGHAKDLLALLDFERAMFDDPYFDDPEPERHATGDQGDVVFSLRFTYYPDGPPEGLAAAAAAPATPAEASTEDAGAEQPAQAGPAEAPR